ncbi:MAG: NTP transferase domain-containing protein [Gammaproteobacteria bacterium]|nr:NTP transferase domain-containing protein [Gammaproteobacteria bacterium]
MTRPDDPHVPPPRGATAPKLTGLVLAGGASRRMGRDKGALDYGGEPQVRRAWRLLASVCGEAFVSTNAARAAAPPYRDLPLILDPEDYTGPAAGLLAAWARRPDSAWLALAVDMPLVDRALLAVLVEGRDPQAIATCFRHDDGTLEPLCTIWEPSARAPLQAEIEAGRRSPRRFLLSQPVAALRPPDSSKLAGANDPRSWDALSRPSVSRPGTSPDDGPDRDF